MTNMEPQDHRLTAWALGELNPEEARQFEAEISHNPAARQQADQIRDLAEQLRIDFHEELPIGELICLPRPVKPASNIIKPAFWRNPHHWIAAAAIILGTFAVIQFTLESFGDHQKIHLAQEATEYQFTVPELRLVLQQAESQPRTLFAGGIPNTLHHPVSGVPAQLDAEMQIVAWSPLDIQLPAVEELRIQPLETIRQEEIGTTTLELAVANPTGPAPVELDEMPLILASPTFQTQPDSSASDRYPAPVANLGKTSISRVLSAARAQQTWKTSTNAEKLHILRAEAQRHPEISTPISDRYLITAHAGVIDLVQFLDLAHRIHTGSDLRETLHHEWTLEGGPDYLARRTITRPTQAHPDDLPSNALGALFGSELTSGADLESSLTAFFTGLRPISENSGSHRQLVLGLGSETTVTRKQTQKAHEWFTALPRFVAPQLSVLDRPDARNAKEALALAGLEVYRIQGQPIGIRRVE